MRSSHSAHVWWVHLIRRTILSAKIHCLRQFRKEKTACKFPSTRLNQFSTEQYTSYVSFDAHEVLNWSKMAKEDKLTQKSAEESKDHSYKLHFIKDCECGVLINEHLLPNAIEDSNLASLFTSCVESLINASIRYESSKFAKILIRAVGNYTEIEIKDRHQLRILLDKLCAACGICPNFINEEKIEECSFCDIEKEEAEPQKKKVISAAYFFPLKVFFYQMEK